MDKNLTCIICPLGCPLTVSGEGENLTVSGNTCPKGAVYARDEILNPTRTITSIVRVTNRIDTMLSVKTAAPISKVEITEAMEIIKQTTVTAPVKIGDVIISDFYGTTLVATKNVM